MFYSTITRLEVIKTLRIVLKLSNNSNKTLTKHKQLD